MKTEDEIRKEIIKNGYAFQGNLVYSYAIVTDMFFMYQNENVIYSGAGRKVAYLEKFGINEFIEWLIENADSYLPEEEN